MVMIAHDLLIDLEKETVDFVDNYDGTEKIPAVLPTRVPNLLVNGSSGIAVGMATNIPPHNLGEVVRACIAVIDNPEITIDELIDIVPGPDFPTAGIINGRAGILQAYRTGRGRIYVRSRAVVETNEKTGRETIIITEIPYQVNKARLIEKIAELVKDKKLEGISEIRDESDKDGLRVVIEIKRGEMGEVVLNNLFAQTQMENVFGINVVALVDGQPKILNLKQLLEHFVRHRREVVTRRTVYLLRKARERGHVLEGQAVAIANIDDVIVLIKNSASPADAKDALLARGWPIGAVSEFLERAGANACRPDELEEQYGLVNNEYYLSPVQVQAILDLRLHRLTGMEHDKLLAEYEEKLAQITEYLHILSSTQRLMEIIREELLVVEKEYADDRRTEVQSSHTDLTVEDLINEEDRVVTLSHGGYAKSQPLDAYQAQRRGGTGKAATAVKDEDFVEHLLIANTHDYILCFTNAGKVYWLKVYQIPVASRTSRGRPMVNLLPLDEGERITSLLPVRDFDEDHFIFMATANGTVKKTPLPQFARPRSVGLRAVDLDEGDHLVGTAITNGNCDIILFSSAGKAARFSEKQVRSMGRISRGVRGMRLDEGQSIISMVIPVENGKVLTVSEKGYGKRTAVEDFPAKGRGGMGVIAMQMSERNGALVGAAQVLDGEEIMLISDQGTLVRTRVDEVSVLSRNTQGVRLIRVRDNEHIVGVARVEEGLEEDGEVVEE
mgnify:FL=1